jgi:hypothetical protein
MPNSSRTFTPKTTLKAPEKIPGIVPGPALGFNGYQQSDPAVVYYPQENRLYAFGASQGGLSQLTAELEDVDPGAGDLEQDKIWRFRGISHFELGVQASVDRPISAIVAGGQLFLFWVQENQVWATRRAPEGNWMPAVALANNGARLTVRHSNFSVTPSPDGQQIIGTWISDDKKSMHWVRLDPGDMKAISYPAPSGSAYQSPAGLWHIPPVDTLSIDTLLSDRFVNRAGSRPKDFGTRVAIQHFAQGNWFAAFNAIYDPDQKTAYLFLIAFKDTWTPGDPFLTDWGVLYEIPNAGGLPALALDPSGDIRAYFPDLNNTLCVSSVNISQAASTDLTWTPPQSLNGQKATVQGIPSAAYIWGPSKTTLTTKRQAETMQQRFEVVAYNDGVVRFQVVPKDEQPATANIRQLIDPAHSKPFPMFSGEQKKVYDYLVSQVGYFPSAWKDWREGKSTNVDWSNPKGHLDLLLQNPDQVKSGAGVSIDPKPVLQQLYNEAAALDNAKTHYLEKMRTFLDTTFIDKTLDMQAVYDKLTIKSKAKAKEATSSFNLSTILKSLGTGLSAAGSITSVAAGATPLGIGVAAGFYIAGGGLSILSYFLDKAPPSSPTAQATKFSIDSTQMPQTLVNLHDQSLDAYTQLKQQITTDWGLLELVSKAIDAGQLYWPDTTTELLEPINKQYEMHLWKAWLWKKYTLKPVAKGNNQDHHYVIDIKGDVASGRAALPDVFTKASNALLEDANNRYYGVVTVGYWVRALKKNYPDGAYMQPPTIHYICLALLNEEGGSPSYDIFDYFYTNFGITRNDLISPTDLYPNGLIKSKWGFNGQYLAPTDLSGAQFDLLHVDKDQIKNYQYQADYGWANGPYVAFRINRPDRQDAFLNYYYQKLWGNWDDEHDLNEWDKIDWVYAGTPFEGELPGR